MRMVAGDAPKHDCKYVTCSILYALCWFDTAVSSSFVWQFGMWCWKIRAHVMETITPKCQLKFDIGSLFRSTVTIHFSRILHFACQKNPEKSHHHFDDSIWHFACNPIALGFHSVKISIYSSDRFALALFSVSMHRRNSMGQYLACIVHASQRCTRHLQFFFF